MVDGRANVAPDNLSNALLLTTPLSARAHPVPTDRQRGEGSKEKEEIEQRLEAELMTTYLHESEQRLPLTLLPKDAPGESIPARLG